MDIDNYAPVLIPTLNRFEHFKRCLESLERCTGASQTDVYVGLDYPPTDKYVDGWEKISQYLTFKQDNNNFHSLIIIRRERNFGVGHLNGNEELLKKEVLDKYNRCIFSEDDNVFAPCFLEYMNKCLEKYKNNHKVIHVCGYVPPHMYGLCNNNITCVIDTSAYGLGFWKEKELSVYSDIDWLYRKIKESKQNTLHLFSQYPAIIYMCVIMFWEKFLYGDVMMSIRNMIDETYNIAPCVPTVKNLGMDGTGLHSGYVCGCEKQVISDSKFFEPDDIRIELSSEYKKRLFWQNMPEGFLSRWLALCQRFFVVVLFLVFDNRKSTEEPLPLVPRCLFSLWRYFRRVRK